MTHVFLASWKVFRRRRELGIYTINFLVPRGMTWIGATSSRSPCSSIGKKKKKKVNSEHPDIHPVAGFCPFAFRRIRMCTVVSVIQWRRQKGDSGADRYHRLVHLMEWIIVSSRTRRAVAAVPYCARELDFPIGQRRGTELLGTILPSFGFGALWNRWID